MTSPPASCALALDIGGTKLSAGVVDRSGALLSYVTESTRPADGASRVLERALALARTALERWLASCHGAQGASGALSSPLRALGVSSIGVTRQDRVELCSNIPGWAGLALRPAIEAAFPDLGVTVANDVKAAALAELWWGTLRGVPSAVYVNLGTGLAAALVIGGEVVQGANGAAGEVGFWLRSADRSLLMAAEGAVPMQDWLGGRGLALRASEMLGRHTEVADLVELSGSDPQVRRLLDEIWDGIAMVVANLAIAMDPEVAVVGGGYVRGRSPVLEHIKEVVGRAVPFPPRVVEARFGADASLHGAAALAFRDIHGMVPAVSGGGPMPAPARDSPVPVAPQGDGPLA